MLVPEIWCRMRVQERDPRFLIENGYLEKVDDFEYDGRTVLASRLGYRITPLFADRFLGRIFETPDAVFPEEMLRPEKQDLAAFAAGVDAIVEAQRRVAAELLRGRQRGGGLPAAEGAAAHHGARGVGRARAWTIPQVRGHVHARAPAGRAIGTGSGCAPKQQRDVALWRRHIAALEAFRATPILAAARAAGHESAARHGTPTTGARQLGRVPGRTDGHDRGRPVPLPDAGGGLKPPPAREPGRRNAVRPGRRLTRVKRVPRPPIGGTE